MGAVSVCVRVCMREYDKWKGAGTADGASLSCFSIVSTPRVTRPNHPGYQSITSCCGQRFDLGSYLHCHLCYHGVSQFEVIIRNSFICHNIKGLQVGSCRGLRWYCCNKICIHAYAPTHKHARAGHLVVSKSKTGQVWSILDINVHNVVCHDIRWHGVTNQRINGHTRRTSYQSCCRKQPELLWFLANFDLIITKE